MKKLEKMKLKGFQELRRDEMLLVVGGYNSGPDEICKGNSEIPEQVTACADGVLGKECYDYGVRGTCTFVDFYGLKPNVCMCESVK